MLMPAFVLGAAGACSAFIELMENSFLFFLFLHIALAAVRASPACIAVDLAGMGSSVSVIDPIFARNRFRPCAYPCVFVLTGVLRMTARAFALGKGMRFGLRCFFGLIAAFSAFLAIPRRNPIGKSGMCSVAIVLPRFAFNRLIPHIRRHARMIAAILRMTARTFAMGKGMRFGLRCFFGLIAAFSAFLAIPRRNLIGKSGMCSVAVVLPRFAFNRFIPHI